MFTVSFEVWIFYVKSHDGYSDKYLCIWKILAPTELLDISTVEWKFTPFNQIYFSFSFSLCFFFPYGGFPNILAM